MINRTNWQVPLLGTALLATLAVSGCGTANGNNPGVIGFENNEQGNNVLNNGGVGGSVTTAAAPYLEVANSNSVAEFSLNETTGSLSAITFNAGQNTITTSATPSCIQQFDLGNGTSALYVGTNEGIEVFTVNNTTGVVAALEENGQPFIQTTGGTVTSLNVGSTVVGNFLYALTTGVGNGELTAFAVQADGSLQLAVGTPSITTNINNPTQLLVADVTDGTAIFVVNKTGGSISSYLASATAATLGDPLVTVPTNGDGGVATTNSGLSAPVSLGIGSVAGANLLLVADSGNNSAVAFGVNGDGTLGVQNVGSLAGNGISSPTTIVGITGTDNFVVASTSPSELASFSMSLTGAVLTITPVDTIATGLNTPEGVVIALAAGQDFLYAINAGGGTGSIAAFTVDSTGVLAEADVIGGTSTTVNGITTTTGGVQTITTGIDVPASNPLDATIVTGE